MSMSQYAIKFQSLSRFAPELVTSEDRKCRRFEKGLCPSLQKLVMGHRIRSFEAMLECARAVEPVCPEAEQRVSVWEPRQQLIGSDSRSSSGNLERKRYRDQRQVIRQLGSQPISDGSAPRGPSSGPIVCHYCSQVGHYRSQCPEISCFECGQFGHVG